QGPVELFLDIEGTPDQEFYYLFGLLACHDGNRTGRSFWADTPQDEGAAWQQFVQAVNEYPEAPIYHYGTFEPTALGRLAARYGTDYEPIRQRLVTVLESVYGKVYFPVCSNGLKDIGSFLGATWS